MKIVIAPNAFKESLSAPQAAQWIEKGVKRVLPGARTLRIPMADGGTMTVKALVASTGGRIFRKRVVGPLGKPVTANYGMLGDGKSAVIEMSSASGLQLVPPGKRNPLLTTTYGTGQLIEAAIRRGARKLIIGIGDSATVDGGAGMAQALGFRLLDKGGMQIGPGGGNLSYLHRIDLSGKSPLLRHVKLLVASDVNNPLTGPHGAARVYGPQKGATPAMVVKLEENLKRFARIAKRDLAMDVEMIPGSGAAGGLGAGLMAFLGAELRLGVEVVAESCRLNQKMRGADLVITGEGRLDGQTLRGKTPIGVAHAARSLGIPVIAINGCLTKDAYRLNRHGIDAIFDTVPRTMPLDTALAEAGPDLAKTAEQVMRLFVIGYRRGKSKRVK
jgi:glycerate kinase